MVWNRRNLPDLEKPQSQSSTLNSKWVTIAFYLLLLQTSPVARHCMGEKARAYDSLHCPLSPTQVLALAVLMTMTSSCHKNHIQLPVSRSVQYTFDVDRITMVETRIATLLTIAHNYCYVIPHPRGNFKYFFLYKPPPWAPGHNYTISAPYMQN